MYVKTLENQGSEPEEHYKRESAISRCVITKFYFITIYQHEIIGTDMYSSESNCNMSVQVISKFEH